MRVLWLIACGFCVAAASAAGAAPLVFEEVVPGIGYVAFDADDGRLRGHAFTLDLTRVDVRVRSAGTVGERRTVEEIARELPQYVAINASFFDERDRAMGRVIDRGQTIRPRRLRSWGALVVRGTTPRIVLGRDLPEKGNGGADLVIQGLPRLVVAGQIVRLKRQIARRTAVCVRGSTLVWVVTSVPIEATRFARWLAKAIPQGGLGCSDALNLDGGPSVQLRARLPGLHLNVEGGWPVPNALVATPRPESGAGPSRP